MTVLDMLAELNDIVNNAPGVPLTGKIMVDGSEILEISRNIDMSLPEDVKEAKWIKDEKERILQEAKSEYEKIIINANKQADDLVEENVITKKARAQAAEIERDAEEYAKVLKMRTYDYVDKMLYDMQGRMDEMNMKYFGEMYSSLEKTFNEISHVLQDNRDEVKKMAIKTKNGEEVSL